MSRLVIGLAGTAGAGKDTVGRYLADRFDFSLIALADPIREGLCAMLGLDAEAFARETKELPTWCGQSPRQLMQSLGTDWGRQRVSGDVWMRIAERRIRQTHFDVAITDVRFPDEADWVRSMGGEVWRIVRPGHGATAHAGHESERAVDLLRADRYLINSGTREQLFERVDVALGDLLGVEL